MYFSIKKIVCQTIPFSLSATPIYCLESLTPTHTHTLNFRVLSTNYMFAKFYDIVTSKQKEIKYLFGRYHCTGKHVPGTLDPST